MLFLRMGFIAFLLLSASLLFAQGDEFADTLGASKQLKEMREEIQRLESQIASSNAQEVDLLAELDNLDHTISLRQSVIKTLSKERVRLDDGIRQTDRQIRSRQRDVKHLVSNRGEMKRQYDALHDVVSRRAVHVYKHWNVDRWTILLGAQSIADLLSRQFYFRKLHHWDTKHMEELSRRADSLKAIETRIQKEQEELGRDLQRQESARNRKSQLIVQKKDEEGALVRKKSDRAAVLTDVRSDRQAMQQRLEEIRQAAEEIDKNIAAMESRRVPEAPPPGYFTSGQSFASLKGKLPWPVSGKVVTRFGKYRHPQLGTITENTGIDIQASKGTPVRAVSDAQVGMVTWLRGFGNTVILDHRDGHYSVYAHLDEINVAQKEWLLAGDIIGSVGETGSLDGPRLHFEIWNKRNIQDPQGWLSKSPLP